MNIVPYIITSKDFNPIFTNPEFHPRKHRISYRTQQRNAKKLRRIKAKAPKH